jgi:hypothetical protein
MQVNSLIFVGVPSIRNKKKINWKKFGVWGSGGIYWVKLIVVCGGGESFKDAFIFTVLSTVARDEERMKTIM